MKKIALSTALLVCLTSPAMAGDYVPYAMQRSSSVSENYRDAQRFNVIAPASGEAEVLVTPIEAKAVEVQPMPEAAPAPQIAPQSTAEAVGVGAQVGELSVKVDEARGFGWDYSAGPRGPQNWGSLNSNYGACASGQSQSPIDISEFTQADLAEFKPFYKSTPIDIRNNGRTIDFIYEPGSGFTVNGTGYKLKHLDFHTPSEHTISGVAAAMELHLVHQADDGSLAVVAVLINPGAANKYLEAFMQNTPSSVGGRKLVSSIKVNAADMLPENLAYYRYQGSLTIPPCSENVQWFVLREPIEASPAQIAAFQKMFPGNARPVQPLNGRVVSGG